VTLRYATGGRERTAAWTFDPLRRLLEPADEEARWLTEEERAAPPPAPTRARNSGPRLASVPATPAVQSVPAASDPDQQPDVDAEAERPPAAKPRAGSRRASVPSWDEILFGSAPRRDTD
jgi:hypothetical protein